MTATIAAIVGFKSVLAIAHLQKHKETSLNIELITFFNDPTAMVMNI